MKADDLEAAIAARDTIKEIDKFLECYNGKNGGGPWNGTIILSIGSYTCELHPSSDLSGAIAEERANALEILQGFGIEFGDSQ